MTIADTTEVAPTWAQRLTGSSRGDGRTFAHLLPQYGTHVTLQNTNARVRVHFVAHDANGQVAYTQLAEQMVDAVVDYCIPRKMIEEADREAKETKSQAPHGRLNRRARSLFVDADGTGEGGELLLYLLTEQILGYPQILAKMDLKTSSNMHYHGSDGVHASFAADGILDLFWGESKLYNDTSKAFSDCFESLAPFIDPTSNGSERHNDILLLNGHLDAGQEELSKNLIRYFDSKNPESLRVRWNGVCLVGFDLEDYPNTEKMTAEVVAQLEKKLKSWHSSVQHRIKKHKLEMINIEVFCVPFPSVDAMRKAVREGLVGPNG